MSGASDGRSLVVEDLHKGFAADRGAVRAVDGVSFGIEDGRFYTLLGPSGCGKTTTLRCVAGLERVDAGRITIDGRVVSSARPSVFVAPDRRSIGMVFQSYAIWPHMTVFDNAAFPLQVTRSGLSKAQITERVEEALATVQLSGYEDRNATQLSGGQQQRLALARAIVRRPRLLLLDEPLSNLDARLRERMRTELRDLQRRIGITTLYVTHDQVEALSMSDRIGVMSQGRILQEDAPKDIYHRPANRFVADFLGNSNFMDATVVSAAPEQAVLRTPIGEVRASVPKGAAAGDAVMLFIRPENIRLVPEPRAAPNSFAGTVEQLSFLGEFFECRLRVGPQQLIARVHSGRRIRAGDRLTVELPADSVAVMHERYGTVSAIADETMPPALGEPKPVTTAPLLTP